MNFPPNVLNETRQLMGRIYRDNPVKRESWKRAVEADDKPLLTEMLTDALPLAPIKGASKAQLACALEMLDGLQRSR